MLKVEDIKAVRFEQGRKGYKVENVDNFVDKVIESTEEQNNMIVKLEEELQGKQTKIVDFETNNGKLQAEVASLNSELAKAKRSLAEVNEQYEKTKSELDEIIANKESIKKTLETVRTIATESSSAIEKRGNLIVANAQLEGEIILKKATDHAKLVEAKTRKLVEKYNYFVGKYKQLLQFELAKFENNIDVIFPELETREIEDELKETLMSASIQTNNEMTRFLTNEEKAKESDASQKKESPVQPVEPQVAPVMNVKPVEPQVTPVMNVKPVEPQVTPAMNVKPVEPQVAPVMNVKPVEPQVAPVMNVQPVEPQVTPEMNVQPVEPQVAPEMNVQPVESQAAPAMSVPSVEPQLVPKTSHSEPEVINIFEENIAGMVEDPLRDDALNDLEGKIVYEKNIPEKKIPEEPFEGFVGNVEITPQKSVEPFEGFVEEAVQEKK